VPGLGPEAWHHSINDDLTDDGVRSAISSLAAAIASECVKTIRLKEVLSLNPMWCSQSGRTLSKVGLVSLRHQLTWFSLVSISLQGIRKVIDLSGVEEH
jgi:hypothetical protein